MNNRWIATAAAACFAIGVWLSHRIEPGVQVKTIILAGDTPALQFLPTGPGPHPVALLAHGYSASKEMLFRYGEALAAAGFVCFSVDLPGHGASTQGYTFMGAVHTLERIEREIGPVDVLVGHSMGGFAGGEAVREGGMKPQLVIAVGSVPVLGDQGPPLLLLAGRFDEIFSPSLLKERRDASLVLSPWSDHVFEAWDPLLVNAAVKAACVTVGRTPPAPPTCWLWRLTGMALAFPGAILLALCIAEWLPRWPGIRGLMLAVFVVATFVITAGHMWIDAAPHLRYLPRQAAAAVIILLLVRLAGRLHIPRWIFPVLALLALVIAVGYVKAGGGMMALDLMFIASAMTPAAFAGTVLGGIASRGRSRLEGDIALAIIMGCATFQWNQPPRAAPNTPQPQVAIKLDTKLLDTFVGQYQFPPDNVFWAGMKLTIVRQGDQLVGKALFKGVVYGPFNIYPDSETNFLVKGKDGQLTFIKSDKGEITAVISRLGGSPDNEGRKLNN